MRSVAPLAQSSSEITVPAQINHFFVLMMENRSLDHMLGFMQGPDYGIEGLAPAALPFITKIPLNVVSPIRSV
jgi:phospholipase C